MTNVVAVQQEAVNARLMKPLIHQVGYGALSRAGKAREPHHAAGMAVQPLALLAGDAVCVPNDLSFVIRHWSLVICQSAIPASSQRLACSTGAGQLHTRKNSASRHQRPAGWPAR